MLNCEDIKSLISPASADECKFSRMTNCDYRHLTYKESIEYIHGLLEKHNRKVIPICVEWFIKSRWAVMMMNNNRLGKVTYKCSMYYIKVVPSWRREG